MIKKIAILLCIALVTLGATAQLPVGGWDFHPTFSGITSIAETRGKVFYLSGASLYSVDKETLELRSLNIANDLNGSGITGVYVQPDHEYIIVVYSDSNMDRINDDGSVVNISDIRDANINGKVGIKHVGFGKGKFYVSTEFGLVTFDEKKSEARETMFTPLEVTCAYGVGDKVVISYDKKLMVTNASNKIVSLNQFGFVGDNQSEYVFSNKGLPIGDNRLLLITATNNPMVVHFDFENDRLIYFGDAAITGVTGVFNLDRDNAVAFNGTKIATYNSEANPAAVTPVDLPAALMNHKISAVTGWNHTWAGNGAGIAEFNASDFANPVQLCDKFGTSSFVSADCNRIRAQISGDMLFWHADLHSGYQFGFTGTPNMLLTNRVAQEGFKAIWTASSPVVERPTYIVQDPVDPETYYVGTFRGGLCRIKNGKVTFNFSFGNNGTTPSGFYGIAYLAFDSCNNFWVIQEDNATKAHSVSCIPYSELSKDNPPLSAWKHFTVTDTYRTTMATMFNQRKGMAFARGQYSPVIYFLDTKGTESTDDDTITRVAKYIDQDNKGFGIIHIGALAEDAKGRLWVGTNNGVIEITDPTKVTEETTTINRLKVPRNDGTGLADYLLESMMVSDISCDNSNRKWISTTTNGVYLVSENGDKILENFTTENSILPSNRVFSVACDPNSSSVFIATDAGVVEYNSTSSPAMKNLNEVYAYPNPVRPDYSGWITVTGLMDNTLVKIADAAGNVFFQGRSEGGMITWDGCNAAGERVKTGVYYVFASHGAASDSSSEGCVTKIMVVN